MLQPHCQQLLQNDKLCPPQGLCTCPVCNPSLPPSSRSQFRYHLSKDACTLLFSHTQFSLQFTLICLLVHLLVSPNGLFIPRTAACFIQSVLCCLGLGWELWLTGDEQEGAFWGNEAIPNLNRGMVLQLYKCTKINELYIYEWISCESCPEAISLPCTQ